MTSNHYGDGGLQAHSMGELYPWAVVVYRRPGGPGIVRLENLVTGERKSDHSFAPDFSDFRQAHALAEADCPKNAAYRPIPKENQRSDWGY